ncbi:hypothetical protein SK128_010243, partial [Halocaridina rubra]
MAGDIRKKTNLSVIKGLSLSLVLLCLSVVSPSNKRFIWCSTARIVFLDKNEHCCCSPCPSYLFMKTKYELPKKKK